MESGVSGTTNAISQTQGEPLAISGEPVDNVAQNAELTRFWAAVRRLPRYLKLAANMARDSNVPRSAKAMLGIGGIYTVSPIDLVPGFIPVAGQLDDLIVLLLALRTAIRACPPAVAESHLQRAGLARTDFDDDLAAAKDTVRWLAAKGARGSKRLAANGKRRLGRLWRETIRPR
jgi:uncharacterized membrane protein YkvA (DUF1232 family)